MAKILIMLTMEYPYDDGNNFLTGECETINDTYDRILVFSLATIPNNKIQHNLNKKWQVFRRKDQQNKILRRIEYLFLGIQKLKHSELKEEIRRTNSIASKLMAIYYYGRLENYWDFIKENMKRITINTEDEVVVYSFWLLQTAHCAGFLKQYLKEKFHCKVVAISRAHRYDLYEYRYKSNYLPFRQTVFQGLDFVYPCSYDGVKYLQERYPQYAGKIKCSYLGIFDHGKNPIMLEKQFIIASCSNIISVKRLQLLAESLSLLEKQGVTDIKWLCIGEGNMKTKLIKYCKKNLLMIKPEFLGYMSNDRVFELYRYHHIDTFVNVSSSEGLPVSIMEAQSMGIPVVATDVGGTSEIVNNDNGVLINSNPDSQDVAAAIVKLKSMDNQEINIKRMNSRKNWKEHFNAKENYANFHKNLVNFCHKDKY